MKKLFPHLLLGFVYLVTSPAQAQFALDPLWSVPPLVRPYVGTSNNERGLAYNPVSGNVLLVSRFGGAPSIHILDGNTGADLGTMNVPSALVAGGTFALSMIGVGADGAIYGANLTTGSATTPLRVYRWADESAMPTLAFSGDPTPGNNQRYGDTIDVRGSGAGTQIIFGSRAGTNAVLLTTTDGSTYTAASINGTGISGGDFGLGIAFGAGDSFWGKGSGGTTLRFMSLSGGAPLQSYAPGAFTNTFSPIGIDSVRHLLAGISIATPDRTLLYDISNSQSDPNAPLLLDSEIFPTDFPNGNGVGSADFWGDLLFVLDTNNGIQAYTVVPEPGTVGLAILGAFILLAARRSRRDGRE